MKLDSPLFDRIRIKPENDRRQRKEQPICEWVGCENTASHRAPKGRGLENQYWRFCLDHVREYNHSYNFFKGMNDDAVAQYQKDALIGHLPTWKMGSFGGGKSDRVRVTRGRFADAQDPFNLFGGLGSKPSAATEREKTVHNAARKSLDVLGLDPGARRADIKARFKELVKRHHPDANGGDKSTEDRLVEIIQAYNQLKAAGFC